MGFVNWCRDRWIMMMRTKPQFNSVLGRKRSSLSSPQKNPNREGKCSKSFGAFICVVTMLYSTSCGVLLVLSEGVDSSSFTTYLVSLIVAGIAAISSGLCVAEYINNQTQQVASIYSRCYQYSSEVLAFFIGWTWIISQTAVISAICKVLAARVNDWTDDVLRKFLEKIFFHYAKDVPSLVFVLIFILFILTGFAETTMWYVIFIPITFMMIAAMYIIGCVIGYTERTFVDGLKLNYVSGIDEVLLKSALCIVFFCGPQSLLRIPVAQVRKNTTVVLGPLNLLNMIIAFVFMAAATLCDKFVNYSSPNEILSLASNILCILSLCSVAIEAFYPLHYTVEDMSSDGLLFRSFSKKWKPFCFSVSSTMVHVLSLIFIGLMSVFMPLLELLYLVVIFPLLIGSTVPYLVLIQRYRDNSSWQYEPMFHTSAKSLSYDKSRKKSEEFQYSHAPGFDMTSDDCELSTTCMEENLTDSPTSDTDIDSVVEQYREQTHIANMSTLESPTNQAFEPTSSTSFRANFCIGLHMFVSFVVALMINFGNIEDHFSVVVILLVSIIFSIIVLSLLICLPQNKKLDKSKRCAKMPSMPWTPGIASMLSCSLLVHSVVVTWKACLSCFIVGTLLYFLYGIRSSTAANSFYNMRPTHITLRPLPSYGNNCISQIVPSQRKLIKSRKHKKLHTGKI